MSTTTSALPSVLFIVLQHGSRGSTADFLAVKEAILARFDQDPEPYTVRIFETNVNARGLTDEGLRICGDRLTLELKCALNNVMFKEFPNSVIHVVAIGHSFGGLLLRYALGYVSVEPDFQENPRLVWSLYVSLATPHLGCLGLPPLMRFGGWIVAHVRSTSYYDMLMHSKELQKLCSPSMLHVMGLFRHRHAYACVHDHLVPFPAASLLLQTPTELPTTHSPEDPENHPHVLKSIHLPPLTFMQTSAVQEHFPTDQYHTRVIATMHYDLRRVGDWVLHPVHFTELFCIPHSAIIKHSSRAVALSAAGGDVVNHLAKLVYTVHHQHHHDASFSPTMLGPSPPVLDILQCEKKLCCREEEEEGEENQRVQTAA